MQLEVFLEKVENLFKKVVREEKYVKLPVYNNEGTPVGETGVFVDSKEYGPYFLGIGIPKKSW